MPRVLLVAAILGAISSNAFAQHVVRNPDWIKRPTAQTLLSVWPREALRKGEGGEAQITCKVTVHGVLVDCVVDYESPPGAGFGQAALAMTPQFLMRPMTLDGKPIEGRINIPIRFNGGGQLPTPRPPPTGTRIPTAGSRPGGSANLARVAWLDAPTYAQMVAAYPDKARKEMKGGHAVLACQFDSGGRPSPCRVIAEAPAGYGFGRAAMALVGDFRASGAATGDTTEIPFTFAPEMLSNTPPVIGTPQWAQLPEAVDVAAGFPAAATAAHITVGHVSMACDVIAGGRLTGCAVTQQSPEGLGFGKAALALSASFQVSLWTEEGLPTVGGRVNVPIRYQPAGTAPPPDLTLARSQCDDLEMPDPKARISACSQIIAAGEASEVERADAYYNRGDLWMRNGDLEQAIADLTAALKLRPDFADALAERGEVFSEKGDAASGRADIDQALRMAPNSLNVLVYSSELRSDRGDFDGAIADLDKAIAIGPTFASAFVARALAWEGKKDFKRAMADLDRSISLHPTCAVCFLRRSELWRDMGDTDHALADANSTIMLDPNWSEGFITRAGVWQDKGDFARAIADGDAAIKASPDEANAYNSRCWSRALPGRDLDQALADCDRAVELGPYDWFSLDSRALTHFKRGEFAKAVADEDAAIGLSAGHAESLFVRGVAEQRMGRQSEGAADIAKATAIDPKIAARYAKWGVAGTPEEPPPQSFAASPPATR